MLHFFRRIRQSLLGGKQSDRTIQPGRFSRYLLYALGEILLVVIGILIALQVDNWSEERKLQQRQFNMLSDIQSDLQSTKEELEAGKSLNEHTLKQYRFLMEAIDTNAPYSQKIDSAMAWIPMFHVPRFTRTAYESLKSQGTDLLTNRSLKNRIADLYENEYLYLTEDQARLEWSLHDNTKIKYTNRYLRYRDNGEIMVFPVDFEKIKADPGFINFLAEMIAIRAGGIRFYENTILKTGEVIDAIGKELEMLKE